MEDIILIGGGGHCKSIIDTIKDLNKFNIIGILDVSKKVGTYINGIKIIGTDEMLGKYFDEGIRAAHITLGSIGDPKHRKRLWKYASHIGFKFPQIVDKNAILGSNVDIGEGVFIGKGCIINIDSQIGNHSIINSGVIIEHDCRIGSFCHIAPGAALSGGVIIGDNTHIGTNATVIQNVNIGMNTLIGAGSVVVNNIGPNMKAYGNPCKEVI
ncbi:acetyltransferase [Tissierella sp.]|uniref:acetyltransferase n=1 Tax=Tissierella sp. TaxID=41274 RepID=UPI0028589061|nr:acetyltransferase [Tissierella sp.]MDR7857541.1 acetyltransferase [Tissierella sp.]